jgi:hypothetical protein
MRELVRRLHRDERGQIVPLFMLGVIGLVLLIVMIVNTGDQLAKRTTVQNAADAAAMSQATWAARSLNVMSMNNVAITQSTVIYVTTGALIPPLLETTAKATKKATHYAAKIVSCCGSLVGALCCGYYSGLATHLAIAVIDPLIDIWDDDPFRILDRFTSIASALEGMNRHLVEDFPREMARIAEDLARRNGLEDAPLFYAGYQLPGENREYDTVPLPVDKSSLLPRVCLTGQLGTPRVPVPDVLWNFQSHGYPRNKGPYPIAKKSVGDAIDEPIDGLKGFPHFENVTSDFDKLSDAAWAATCLVKSFSIYDVRNKPLPFVSLDVEQRNKWSLVAFTRMRHDGATVSPAFFKNPPGNLYGFAQAEIYNNISYDLYTQDWRAKLVPGRLLESRQYPQILRAVQEDSKLYGVLRRTGLTGMRTTNAH